MNTVYCLWPSEAMHPSYKVKISENNDIPHMGGHPSNKARICIPNGGVIRGEPLYV